MKQVLSMVFAACVVLLTACAPETVDVKHSSDTAKSSRVNVQLGIAYMKQGKYEIARNRLNKAIAYDSDNAQAYSSMALLNVRLKQFKQAEQNFQRAVDLAPDHSGIRNNYGAFLCKQKRYPEAEAQFVKVLGNPLYPRPDVAYLNAGICTQDDAKAEQYFRAALRKNPKFPSAIFQMAKLSLKLKRHLAARGYLQRLHSIQKPTAASLWISIRVEKVLGDRGLMQSHILLLTNKYPDSDETRQYHEWSRQ